MLQRTPAEKILALLLFTAGLNATAQIVELRATISAAQEVPVTNSPATGTAIMLYNVATNTFDLFVTLGLIEVADVRTPATGAN